MHIPYALPRWELPPFAESVSMRRQCIWRSSEWSSTYIDHLVLKSIQYNMLKQILIYKCMHLQIDSKISKPRPFTWWNSISPLFVTLRFFFTFDFRFFLHLTLAFFRVYLRYFAFDFRGFFYIYSRFFDDFDFCVFRLWISRFSLLIRVFSLFIRIFFAFDFRVFFAFDYAFFRLYSRYLVLTFAFFAFDFRFFAFHLRYFAVDFCLWLSRFFTFDFRVWFFFLRIFKLFRIWLLRFLPLFALLRLWLSRSFFTFIRVISRLTFGFFALEFCVFSPFVRVISHLGFAP